MGYSIFIPAGGGGGAVDSVNGQTGVVSVGIDSVLTENQVATGGPYNIEIPQSTLTLYDGTVSSRLLQISNTSNANIISVSAPTLSAPRVVTFGDFAGQVTINNATQTLTNKTISGADNTISNLSVTALSMNTDRLLGRTTASTGAVEEIEATDGLALSSGSLIIDSSYGNTFTTNRS